MQNIMKIQLLDLINYQILQGGFDPKSVFINQLPHKKTFCIGIFEDEFKEGQPFCFDTTVKIIIRGDVTFCTFTGMEIMEILKNIQGEKLGLSRVITVDFKKSNCFYDVNNWFAKAFYFNIITSKEV
ncbi:MAG: hypothetical protein ACK5LV_04345 [Lachnospirales bacterium]